MSRFARVIGVRLSGLVVRDASARTSLIPWLRGGASVINPIAIDDITADAQPTVRGIWWIGREKVRALRCRAFARALRDGSLRRTWSIGNFINIWRIALITAIALGIMVASVHPYFCSVADRMDAGTEEAAELRGWSSRVLLIGSALIVSVATILQTVVAVSRYFGREIVGVRTTAEAITYILADASEVQQSWVEFATSKCDPSRPVRGLFFGGPVGISSEWMALRAAAKRVYGEEKRRWKLSRWRKWEIPLSILAAPAAVAAMFLILPDRPSPRGGLPMSTAERATLSAVMWLWLFVILSLGVIVEKGMHHFFKDLARFFGFRAK